MFASLVSVSFLESSTLWSQHPPPYCHPPGLRMLELLAFLVYLHSFWWSVCCLRISLILTQLFSLVVLRTCWTSENLRMYVYTYVCICICHYELTYCSSNLCLFVPQNIQHHPKHWCVTSHSCHLGTGPWRTKGSYFHSSVYLGICFPTFFGTSLFFYTLSGKIFISTQKSSLGGVAKPYTLFNSLAFSALKMEWKYLEYNANVTGCHCTPASSKGLPHESCS